MNETPLIAKMLFSKGGSIIIPVSDCMGRDLGRHRAYKCPRA